MQKNGAISLTSEQILWLVLFILAFVLIYVMLKSRILDGLFGKL